METLDQNETQTFVSAMGTLGITSSMYYNYISGESARGLRYFPLCFWLLLGPAFTDKKFEFANPFG